MKEESLQRLKMTKVIENMGYCQYFERETEK